jgi:hypothetical protein
VIKINKFAILKKRKEKSIYVRVMIFQREGVKKIHCCCIDESLLPLSLPPYFHMA